jgi:flavodoxin
MKTLVLYDSKYGNTKIIAESIAQILEGQLAFITDFNPEMLAEVDLLVVGSPIHGWHASEDIGKFLAHLEKSELKGKFVAAFDTGYDSKFAGNAAAKIEKALQKAGGKPLISTHKFVVTKGEGPLGPDEISNANVWAHDLKSHYEEATNASAATHSH